MLKNFANIVATASITAFALGILSIVYYYITPTYEGASIGSGFLLILAVLLAIPALLSQGITNRKLKIGTYLVLGITLTFILVGVIVDRLP